MKLATILVGLILALATTHLGAAADDGLEGTWEGFLNPTPAAEIRVILRVVKAEGTAWKATAESPEIPSQGTAAFDEVSLKGSEVLLQARATAREFRGTLNPSKTEIVGQWKKGTSSVPVTFTRLEGPVIPSDVWEGAIELPGGIKLRLVFHVLKRPGGDYRSTLDSPDQGAFGIKVSQTEVSKDSIKLVAKAIGGEYQGKFSSTGETLEGQWKQGGSSFPAVLKKVAKVTEVRRPQEPREPYPYVSEMVTYESRAKGVRIAGTLTLPEGDGPFPVALLITGSGAQDRDESLLSHKPFLVLADDLTRRGIAVLRVDDRGVGGSTGDHSSATTADFAEDVLGGVDFLKGRKRIDPRRIGLVGHSEGGLIAPIVATRSADVAFIVLLAGPGLPGDQILMAQQTLIMKALGAGDEEIRKSSQIQAKLIAIAKETDDPKVAAEKLKAAAADLTKALPEAERKAMAESDPNGSQLGRLVTPWFHYFLTYDPRPTLSRVRCPILAINGEKDLQVPSKDNLQAVDQAVRSGGNDRITIRELAGLNHLFQACTTGAPSEYGTIEETFNPAALKVIGEWITAQSRPR